MPVDYYGIVELLDQDGNGGGADYKISHSHPQERGMDDLIAIEDTMVVGYLGGKHSSISWKNLADYAQRDSSWSCSFISRLFIAPQYRGRGIGQEMISQFEHVAALRGNDLVITHPKEDEDLQRRRVWFERQGYTLRMPSTPGENAWLVAKEL